MSSDRYHNKVDNFAQAERFLDFSEPNTIYIIQIMQRKKDISTLDKQRKMLKVIYISSVEEYNDCKQEIRDMCALQSARAYLVLNKRITGDKFALDMIGWVSTYAKNKQYDKLHTVYHKAIGQDQDVYYWLLDIDSEEAYEKAMLYINSHPKKGDKKEQSLHIDVQDIFTTFSGYHIIVKPFNPCDYYKHMNCSLSQLKQSKDHEEDGEEKEYTETGGGEIIKYANMLLYGVKKTDVETIPTFGHFEVSAST